MTVKITIHKKKGTCTLSGLSFEDLRCLMTAASLYRYQEDKTAKDQPVEGDMAYYTERNNIADRSWRKRQRQNLKLFELAMERHYWKRTTPLTKAERRKAVDDNRELDRLLEEYVRKRNPPLTLE